MIICLILFGSIISFALLTFSSIKTKRELQINVLGWLALTIIYDLFCSKIKGMIPDSIYIILSLCSFAIAFLLVRRGSMLYFYKDLVNLEIEQEVKTLHLTTEIEEQLIVELIKTLPYLPDDKREIARQYIEDAKQGKENGKLYLKYVYLAQKKIRDGLNDTK